MFPARYDITPASGSEPDHECGQIHGNARSLLTVAALATIASGRQASTSSELMRRGCADRGGGRGAAAGAGTYSASTRIF